MQYIWSRIVIATRNTLTTSATKKQQQVEHSQKRGSVDGADLLTTGSRRRWGTPAE
jgi:hypothetical protein